MKRGGAWLFIPEARVSLKLYSYKCTGPTYYIEIMKLK